jgi:hypothetical protein
MSLAVSPSITRAYATLPLGVYVVAGFAILLGALSPNPLLTVVSLVSLVAFIKLLWRPGETPVLVFAILVQWVHASSKIFQANYHGVPIEEISPYASVAAATWATLAGLWVITLAIRLALSRLGKRDYRTALHQVARLSLAKLGLLYALTTLALSSISPFAAGMGGLRQMILAAAGIKWVLFFLLIYAILVRRERYWILVAAAGYELIMGIGFFSGFKSPLFILLIAYFAARPRVTTGSAVFATAMGAFLIVLALGWTSVKLEFRSFLNQGTVWQTVEVSNEAKLAKLGELVVGLSLEDLDNSVDPLFRRLDAVQFFAATMDYVPAVRPHEGGMVWGDAFSHVFQPRILFPNKPRLPSDSEHTMAYTGLVMASGDQGTSISIGYMGDSYIDFGIPGMFMPLFLLGLYWGGMYYVFMRRNEHLLFGSAFATAAMLEAWILEVPAIKLLGGSLTRFIILLILFRFVAPPLMRWLQAGGHESKAPSVPVAQTVS